MASQPFRNSKHVSYKKLALIGSLIVVGLLIFVHVFLPYIDNKSKLVKEAALIQPNPYTTMSETYIDGACLDNCPELTTIFTIPATPLGTERTKMANLLRSKGYIFDKPMPGDNTLTANHGKFHLDIGFGGNSGSPGLLNSSPNDAALINKLVFTLDYTP